MHGKEFTINRKSAVKKDKALRDLEIVEEKLADIKEKQKILLSLTKQLQGKKEYYTRVIKKNT